MKTKQLTLILISICTLLLLAFSYLRYRYQNYEKTIQEVLNKGKENKLTYEDLVEKFGKPKSDEIQEKKIYNIGSDMGFNCTPPFRFLRFDGGLEILSVGKLEDSIYFYFDRNNQFCYFERMSL